MKPAPLLPTTALLTALAASVLEGSSHAAPARRIAPSLPPRPATQSASETSATKSKAKARPQKVVPRTTHPIPHSAPLSRSTKDLGKLPPPAKKGPSKSLSRPALGRNSPPRNPVRGIATGAGTSDPLSAGLADDRLRANATAPQITLEDAITFALADNPRRREAQAAVNAATAQITNVGSQGKLQVGLSGSSTYSRNTTTGATTGGSASSGGTTGGSTGGSSSGSTPSGDFQRADLLSLNASLPVTTGGRVRASTRAARYNALAQIYQLAQVEQDLVLSTTLSYLDVLRAEQLVRVTNSNLAVSQERLRVARVRYTVGASARLDVLRAQTDLADARSRRILAVNQLGTSNSALNTLLGRAPETPIRIVSITRLTLPNVPLTIRPSSSAPASGAASSVGNAAAGATTTTAAGSSLSGVTNSGVGNTTVPGAVTNAVPGTATTAGGAGALGGLGAAGGAGATGVNGAVGTGTTTTVGAGSGTTGSFTGTGSTGLQTVAGGSRQSLAVTQAQIGAAEAAIEVAKSGKRPSIGLSLTSLLRNPATFLGSFGAAVGLGVAQNLFDSRRTRSQVDEARAALAQLQQRLAGQRLEVANAIDASLLNLDSAERRSVSAESGVTAAQEALRVAQLGFRSGVSTTLDLANAQAAVLAAQTDAVNARFDVADAQATLAAAVGIYTQEAQEARNRAILAEQEAAEQARVQQEILQPKKKKRRKFLGIF